MKTLNFKFLAILLVLFVSAPGCKEDEEEGSKFIGDYVIDNAELSKVLIVPTNEIGNFSIPVGTVITQAIQTALLSAVNCSSADKSYVELREDFSMYLSCEGSNQLNAGTWEEVSATSLRLNMNNAAIPSSPTGIALTVTDIVTDATSLTGKTSVPLPKEMVAAMIAPLQFTLEATATGPFIAEFSIEFIKK